MRISEEEKKLWLEDWRGSGKSAWAYAKENGLVAQTFVRWTKGKREEKSLAAELGPCLVEVSAQVIPSVRQAPEILIEKGEMKIHIPLGIGSNELRAMMEGLRCAL